LSLRRKVSHFLALVVVAALAVGLMAGPASAKVSAKKRAQVSRQLRKAVKKNPRVIRQRWFLKKASLVNFKLPVTIRLRGINPTTGANPNSANIDLGTSLGQREIDLGGSLAAEIVFHDAYDGGALGNVDVNILHSTTKQLTSTSVPLLWNQQVSQAGTSWDSNLLASAAPTYSAAFPAGCGNVHTTDPSVNDAGNLQFGYGFGPQPSSPGHTGSIAHGGLPGVPIYHSLADYQASSPEAFAPAPIAAVDDIDAVTNSKIPGNNDWVGGSVTPFPYSASSQPDTPGYFSEPPAAHDTVLRTNALKLDVATSGIPINQSTNTNGVAGSQNIVIGKSGGQANLFGQIPGKGYGIDVTVNLHTQISSIFRVVDQDAFEPLIEGGNWPAAVFSCGQIWSGYVDNYIPAVHLKGNLRIAPAITADGKLRIAKASLSQLGDPSRVALAACLSPYAAYNAENNSSDTVQPTVPGTSAIAAPDGTVSTTALPVKAASERSAPNVPCNTAPTSFVAHTALAPSFTVNALGPALPADGYTVSNSGSAVSVAGDLTVTDVEADILVGDV
jgi:hypothetical protein